MRLNYDLVRKVLLLVQDGEARYAGSLGRHFDDGKDYVSGYYLAQQYERLMVEGGLIHIDCGEISLTAAGHEAADLIRNNDLWGQAKAIIQEKVGSASWSVTLDLVKKLTLEAIATSPGLGLVH